MSDAVLKFFYSIGELLAGAVSVSLAALLVLPDWRANPQYVFAGWLVGPLCGAIILRFEFGAGWALLAATIGAIMAPALVAWFHGKSPTEVAQQLIDLKNTLHGKSEDLDKPPVPEPEEEPNKDL